MGECKDCDIDGFRFIGCCSGHECVCMGQPVAITNCLTCNPNNEKSGIVVMLDPIAQHLEFCESKESNSE